MRNTSEEIAMNIGINGLLWTGRLGKGFQTAASRRYVTMMILLSNFVLFFACYAPVRSSPMLSPIASNQQRAEKRRFVAEIEVSMRVEKLNKAGIVAADVMSALDAYYRKHDSFNLSDLLAIKVLNDQKKGIELKDFATVEVTFKKPPKSPD